MFGNLASLRLQFLYVHVHVYVRDQCKTRTVLKPSDGFEAGQTVLQLFISTTNGFKAVQTDEQLSWTV